MEDKKTAAEKNKENSAYLKGTVPDAVLSDSSHFTSDESALLKFHGTYQQDDRDVRGARVKEKKEPLYGMMVRSKIPGGRLTAAQYLNHDDLAGLYGNGTLRITTRQGFQFHGVLKKNLKAVIRSINEKLGTTSGACGDIVRNVMACPAPASDRSRMKVFELAKSLSDQFLSKSGTYQEIWLDGKKTETERPPEEAEPIYGKAYLPRKFKIGMACPDDNCIDVYTHDLGIVPELDASGGVAGFTLLVGGGLGMTHGIEKTYPRLATPLCFVTPEDLAETCKAIVLVQRDNGNRQDRKRARLKYLLDERGVPWFRSEVEKRLGKKTQDPHPIRLKEVENHLGWHPNAQGAWYLGVFIENGRIKDEGSLKLRTGLRALVEKYKPDVYLTAQQDILFSGFQENQKKEVEDLLRSHGIKLPWELAKARLDSIACPALPTCGLAISESERVMPGLMDEWEKEVAAQGLEDQKFIIRMTGCPNGCARPYNAEIALVGRNPGIYNVYVGGSLIGDRMAWSLADKVPLADIVKTLRPVLSLYRKEREKGEGFGDFCFRSGAAKLKNLISASAASQVPHSS
ncbi:MAG TPA: NADPH-dependent assimilatory sulfite reductase hemoprotein subunit [Verrucomicrobiae bacterium]|jgi:sulfite reductase (ferredoxin)|nr:NADPH-dependent assimilatory sulfite reductase hemoprotein subunit [Verrucomicrobiae bacterium]